MLGEVVGDVLPGCRRCSERLLKAALLLGDSALAADPRAVAAGFLGALRLLAAERTLCLAVDDVQWLDAASFLSAIRYAVARLRHERVATLLAVRDEVPEWVSHAVVESRLERSTSPVSASGRRTSSCATASTRRSGGRC